MESNVPTFLRGFRSVLIVFIGISISLPIAWISLAKVLLLLSVLVYISANYVFVKKVFRVSDTWTSKVTLAVLVLFSISLAWTESTNSFAFVALVKHAKLIEILLLLILIRTIRDAKIGILALIAGQSFLLTCSWLLATGVSFPWKPDSLSKYVVFSSYLDQSIMFASMAAVAWHLRNEKLWPKWMSLLFTAAALANVFFLLEGRTGHVVGVLVLSLILMWSVPKRYRIVAIALTSIILSVTLYIGSIHFKTRLAGVVTESQQYFQKTDIKTSAGWRLNAWHRSLQAIAEKPFFGHGVGSWALTVKRIEGEKGVAVFGESNLSNPHQEYLLWGVELGALGLLLFLLLLFSIAKDALQYSEPIKRAIFSVVAVLTVACLFNSAVYDDLIGDYFCITLGLLMAYGIQTRIAETSDLD